MTLWRGNVVLLVAVAAAASLHVALREPVRLAEGTGTPFSGLDPADARRIELEAEGERLELRRRGDGWVLPDRYGLAAHAWSVDTLLAAVAAVREADLVGDRPDSWPLYGVGASGLRARIVGPGGVTLASFVQGGDLRSGQTGTPPGTFVRPAAGDRVYRADGLAPLSVEADAWLDTRLVAAAPEDVRRVVVGGAGREPRAVERAGESWRGEAGADVPASVVGTLLAELTAAHFTTALGAGPAPDAPEPAWVVVLAGAGETREVALLPPGAGAGEGRAVARARGGEAAGLLELGEAAARSLEEAAARLHAAAAGSAGRDR